jgi:hypothetical protein
MLTSCQYLKTQTTGTIKSEDKIIPCESLLVIQYSSKEDSVETVEQVRKNNAVIEVLCK